MDFIDKDHSFKLEGRNFAQKSKLLFSFILRLSIQ